MTDLAADDLGATVPHAKRNDRRYLDAVLKDYARTGGGAAREALYGAGSLPSDNLASLFPGLAARRNSSFGLGMLPQAVHGGGGSASGNRFRMPF